jgi:hypothetical protein
MGACHANKVYQFFDSVTCRVEEKKNEREKLQEKKQSKGKWIDEH